MNHEVSQSGLFTCFLEHGFWLNFLGALLCILWFKLTCVAFKHYHFHLNSPHHALIVPVSFQGNVISTPAVKGTILPGITRKSIIDVARSQGFQVF